MKPRIVRKYTQPPGEAFVPPSIEQNDENVFRQADYFTVSRRFGIGAPTTIAYDDFAEACLIAWPDENALVYAVTAMGRSTCLIRSRWAEYLAIWKQMHGLA
jgi:hypothetical protein